MEDLQIHTHINSRYRVFDASGKHPFSIIFGFWRHSKSDTDPRTILLEIAGSVLDVPYALGHGLLILEQNLIGANEWVKVDVGQLSNVAPNDAGYFSVPPTRPLKSGESKLDDAFTIYQCHLEAHGEVAYMLEVERNYRIRIASRDLGVRWWAYSDEKEFTKGSGDFIQDSGAQKMVNSKSSGGHASFKIVENLRWPPSVETKLRLSDTTVCDSPRAQVEVSVTNTSTDTVTVQMMGTQRFLIPWGPYQPEPEIIDYERTTRLPGPQGLQVINAATGEVVRGKVKRHTGCRGLTSGNIDRRPKIEDVLVLKPREPLIRHVDISLMIDGLEDGNYEVRMISRGCRWWHGEIRERDGEDGRVPLHLGGAIIPPLMLESQDTVSMCVRDGKLVESL